MSILKFGVGNPNGQRSHIWSISSNKKGDVYAMNILSGNIEKCSFHALRDGRRECNHALTQWPSSGASRFLQSFDRSQTPYGKATAVLQILFPQGYLSGDLPNKESKNIRWFSPATKPDTARLFVLYYTNQDEDLVKAALKTNGCDLLVYDRLESGEAVFVTTKIVDVVVNDLIALPNGTELLETVFSKRNPLGLKRDSRITLGTPLEIVSKFRGLDQTGHAPKAGMFSFTERTGFRVARGVGATMFPNADKLARANIIATQADLIPITA